MGIGAGRRTGAAPRAGSRASARILLRAAVVAATVVAAPGLAGCGDEGAVTTPDNRITLVVDIFADQGFGYDELYDRYMAQHPNILIQQRGLGLGLGDYNDRLTQWMASDSGAGDIVALEEGTIVQFQAQADNFVNLLDHVVTGSDEKTSKNLAPVTFNRMDLATPLRQPEYRDLCQAATDTPEVFEEPGPPPRRSRSSWLSRGPGLAFGN